jgi:hypothetical protein
MRFNIRIDRRWVAAASLVLAAAGITGAAFAASGAFTRQQSRLVSYSHRGFLTPHTQANATPASLLSSIVSSLASPAISSVGLGGPPAGVRETDDPSVPNSPAFAKSLWLRVTVKASALTEEATTKPIWLGNLVTGALRDKLYAAGQTPLFSSLVSVDLPDGSKASDVGGGVGGIKLGQIFSSASDNAIKSQIQSVATAAGYAVDSVDVVHADQPAPAVVVTTSDPQAAAANPDQVLSAIFGPPGTYEGEYLEVRAQDGTLAFVQGSAFRTGVGQRWINPAFGRNSSAPPTREPSK